VALLNRVQNRRTVGFHFFKKKTFENQRTVGVGCFKSLKEPAGFMKEPAKNRWVFMKEPAREEPAIL
jgi:hypothetical protein